MKLDQENRKLQAEMKANVKAREVADDECKHLLDILEEVGPAGETCEQHLTLSLSRLAQNGKTSPWKKFNLGPSKPQNPSTAPH